MATIKDVARMAGVSTSTVSRVLNSGAVSRDAARRVREAVEALDYRASAGARILTRRYADIVGVIVVDISNPPISQMFKGISNRLHERGMTVMLGNTEAEPELELEFLRMFASHKARGVIYTGMQISPQLARALRSFSGPVVVTAQGGSEIACPTALFDNYQASRDVASRMLAAGHLQAGMISGPAEDLQAGEARRRGFCDGYASAGHPIPGTCIEHAEFSIDSGYEAMCRMVDRGPALPTAVHAGSDLIAIGAMRYLQDHGVAVPRDVSIVGFDNIAVGASLIPSLSTVELDFHELGEVAADLLCRQFEREESQVREVVFTHKIIMRESFAPAAGGQGGLER